MEKTKLQQLEKLLEELRQERIEIIAKDLQYNSVADLLKNYDEFELEEYDDGDNLLQDVNNLIATVQDLQK